MQLQIAANNKDTISLLGNSNTPNYSCFPPLFFAVVRYKYIKNYFQDDPGAEEFCKKHNIVYISKTKDSEKKLQEWLKKTKLPKVESDLDVICYWRSYGTWGMYHPEDNSISICPFQIEKAGGLVSVIRHELEHLKHPEADKLSHVEKEKLISKVR